MRSKSIMSAVRNVKVIVMFFRSVGLCFFDSQIVPVAMSCQRVSLRGGKSYGMLGRKFGSLGGPSGGRKSGALGRDFGNE